MVPHPTPAPIDTPATSNNNQYLVNHILQKRYQIEQLRVALVVQPAQYRNAVIDLEYTLRHHNEAATQQRKPNLIAECLWGIVDDHGFVEISAEDSQIFDIVPVDAGTMLAE